MHDYLWFTIEGAGPIRLRVTSHGCKEKETFRYAPRIRIYRVRGGDTADHTDAGNRLGPRSRRLLSRQTRRRPLLKGTRLGEPARIRRAARTLRTELVWSAGLSWTLQRGLLPGL